MRNRGFTLIELLAVIVILAIIALIVVPIVLNIIDDADKESEADSAKMYIHAVELAIAKTNMSTRLANATCTVQVGGNLSCDGKDIEVDINNKDQIKGGTITIERRKVTKVINLKVGNGTYNMGTDGKLVLSDGTEDNTFTGTIYRNSTEGIAIGDSIIPMEQQMWCGSEDGSSCMIKNEYFNTKQECLTKYNLQDNEATGTNYNITNNQIDATPMGKVEEKPQPTSCIQTTVTTGLTSYETDSTRMTKDFYLKHIVENDIVKESYACIRYNDNGIKEACVRGGDPSYYGYDATNPTGNVAMIKSTQSYFEANGGCDFYDSDSRCSSSSLWIGARSDGYVDSSGDHASCRVDERGNSRCIATPGELIGGGGYNTV